MEAARRIFEQISLDSVSDAVVAQIERLITAGVLRSGQKLPPERELSELLDVSRPKVRDALKVLEDRGLVSVRHGEGTFIAPLTGTALSGPMIELFARQSDAFFDYLEFRREVESFAAFAAAQRATATDHAILREKIAQMEAAHLKADPTEEADLDVTFHAAVVDAAHNVMLVHMMSSIYELMTKGVFYNRAYLYQRAGARDVLLDQHREIAEAVIAGDPDRAAQAAETHIDYTQEAFRIGAAETGRDRIARKRKLLAEIGPKPKRHRD